jgi:3alpha(or 20beta)-hydroxysteroid dehydrogenase
MPRLTGKVAVITGAANGQGAADAALFAAEGAALLLTDRDEVAGEALAARLRDSGARALFRTHDVVDETGWRAIVAAALAEFGGLHVLVNNAGTIAYQGIADSEVKDWDRVIAVNLTGPLLGMKHCAPAMRDTVAKTGGGGSIINISSTAGLTAHLYAAYTASKWGLRGLTKTAVLEFAPWNVRVNSIHPGLIDDTSFARDGDEAFRDAARRAVPLGRLGLPQDTAQLVLFLASDDSAYINGAEIGIDGGYIAAGLSHLRNRARQQYQK